MRRALRPLLLLAASGLVCLFAAELAVRRLAPQPLGFSWLTADGLQLHVPGRRATYRRSEFAAEVRINAHGFRGAEFVLPKPAGTFRITALGDSFVEGMQVGEEALVTTRIADALGRDGRRVDVVNLGVSGHGTDDALDVFRRFGPLLEPDLALLFFCVANDLQNNALEGRCRRENGRLHCDERPKPTSRQLAFAHLKSRFSTHSELYQALQASATHPFWQRIGLRAATPPTQMGDAGSFLRDAFAPAPPPPVAEAIAITADLLAALRDEARRLGAPLWLVVAPIREQVENAEWARFAADRALARDAPQRALADAARALDIPVIDLLPAFRARDAAGERLYWRIDAHWNEAGHALAAAEVAAALADVLPR